MKISVASITAMEGLCRATVDAYEDREDHPISATIIVDLAPRDYKISEVNEAAVKRVREFFAAALQ